MTEGRIAYVVYQTDGLQYGTHGLVYVVEAFCGILLAERCAETYILGQRCPYVHNLHGVSKTGMDIIVGGKNYCQTDENFELLF